MALTKPRAWRAITATRWPSGCFDAVEVRDPPGDADQLRSDKPDRAGVGKRIDVVPTAAMAVTRWRELAAKHERRGVMIAR